MKRIAYLAITVCTFVTTVSAHAQPLPSTQESARTVALGSGSRANAVSTAALFQNPAGLAAARLYHLEAMTAFERDEERWSFGGAAVDSALNDVLAAGFGLRGVVGNDQSGHSGIDGRLGIALGFSEAFSFGVTGRYLRLVQEGQPAAQLDPDNPDAPEMVPSEVLLAEGFTFDVGVRVQPIPMLSFSVVGLNLLDRDSALTPISLAVSGAIAPMRELSIGLDGIFDFSTFGHVEGVVGGGSEFLVASSVPLRLGYQFDTGRELHAITGGIGYVSGEVGIEFSVRQQLNQIHDTYFIATLRYFVF